jgi:hypothetical protein
MQNRETIVAVVSDAPTERLTVVLRAQASKPIVIRTESFSESVGWYTQQEMELTRSEFSGLKNVLGLRVPVACEQAIAATADSQEEKAAILSFNSARRCRA